MGEELESNGERLRQAMLPQTIWSETFGSLKDVLKQVGNQLPLLVRFSNDDSEHDTSFNSNNQTILFFDRNLAKKSVFMPLRPLEDVEPQFEIFPHNCTFTATDFFKGIFEFVIRGQRTAFIFDTINKIVEYSKQMKYSVMFMSRDKIIGYYKESDSSSWSTKEYIPGSVFQGQRIHRSTKSSSHRMNTSTRSYLECLDEENYSVFLHMNHIGRFSLIATSITQNQTEPQQLLYPMDIDNFSKLVKRLIPGRNSNSCMRLVRGSVPYNFKCQYFQLVRQHAYDVLVGITKEGLVIEWNLDSAAPCRYAINFNFVLSKLYGTWEQPLLETYIDAARAHYRENFCINMQLITRRDWSSISRYWRWTNDTSEINDSGKHTSDQRIHRLHWFTSIQDLSDDQQRLSAKLHQQENRRQESFRKENDIRNRKDISDKQCFSMHQMSDALQSSSHQKINHKLLTNHRSKSAVIKSLETPFDNSVYDSNQPERQSANIVSSHTPKRSARRTQ